MLRKGVLEKHIIITEKKTGKENKNATIPILRWDCNVLKQPALL